MERIGEIPSEGSGKFVQVKIDDEPYIRLGPMERVHSNMLKDLLIEAEVEFKTIKDQAGENIVKRKGERYDMVGAGVYRVPRNQELIILTGKSMGYEIGPNIEHLGQLAKHVPDDLVLKIEG